MLYNSGNITRLCLKRDTNFYFFLLHIFDTDIRNIKVVGKELIFSNTTLKGLVSGIIYPEYIVFSIMLALILPS